MIIKKKFHIKKIIILIKTITKKVYTEYYSSVL